MNDSGDLDLLEAYLEGRLLPAEAEALETRLKAEPALARTLVSLARDEILFARWAQAELAAEEEPAPVTNAPAPASRPTVRRSRLLPVLIGLAAAGLLFLALRPLLNRPAPHADPKDAGPAPALAQLGELQGNVYVVKDAEKVAARPGQEVRAGEEVRTEGEDSFAVVSYTDATRLELGGDTTVRLPDRKTATAGKQVFLEEGTLAASIAPQPADLPMLLTTPHAELRLAGTRFVSSSAPAATRIDIEEGKVRLTRRSDGKTIDLQRGTYAIVARADTAFVPQPLPRRITTPRRTLHEGSGPLRGVAYLPDGKALVTLGWDRKVKVWDALTGTLTATRETYSKRAEALAVSPDGKTLATAGADPKPKRRTVKLWDLPGLRERLALPMKGDIHALAFSPDGRLLAVAGQHGKGGPAVILLDAATGEPRLPLTGAAGRVRCLAFAPDGNTLAGGDLDGRLRLWNVTTGRGRKLPKQPRAVQAVGFAPDGRTLASGSRDGTVKLWDVASGRERRTLPGPCGEVRALAFSPDGLTLATANGGTARLWDVAGARERAALVGHRYAVLGLAFSPDGRTLATAGSDRKVNLWDVAAPAGDAGRR